MGFWNDYRDACFYEPPVPGENAADKRAREKRNYDALYNPTAPSAAPTQTPAGPKGNVGTPDRPGTSMPEPAAESDSNNPKVGSFVYDAKTGQYSNSVTGDTFDPKTGDYYDEEGNPVWGASYASKKLTSAQVLDAFQHGFMSANEAQSRLQKDGYAEKDIGTLIKLNTPVPGKKPQLSLQSMKDAFDAGKVDATGLTKRLTDSGYGEEDVNILLGQITAPDQKAKKDITGAALQAAFNAGRIGDQQVQQQLEKEGYSSNDAIKILQGMLDTKKKANQQPEAKQQRPAAPDNSNGGNNNYAPKTNNYNQTPRAPNKPTSSDYYEKFKMGFAGFLKGSNASNQAKRWAMQNSDQFLENYLGSMARQPGGSAGGGGLPGTYGNGDGSGGQMGNVGGGYNGDATTLPNPDFSSSDLEVLYQGQRGSPRAEGRVSGPVGTRSI